MNALEKIRAEYVQRYGATSPASFEMILNPSVHSGYKGCRIENSEIIFEFSTSEHDGIDLVETQFCNRLSRKVSFESDAKSIGILISDYAEERGEYLTAAMDLDNYFRGKEATVRLKAEHALYRHGENWRDPMLVAQEIKKMMEKH